MTDSVHVTTHRKDGPMLATRKAFTFKDAKQLLRLFNTRTNKFLRHPSLNSPVEFGRLWQRIDDANWDFCAVVQFLNQNTGGFDTGRSERFIEVLSRFVLQANVLLEFVSQTKNDFPSDQREFVKEVAGRIQGVIDRCDKRIARHKRLIDKSTCLQEAVNSIVPPAPVLKSAQRREAQLSSK